MLDFGREICGNFDAAVSREWLVTNGLGGYASGTVAGVLTRRYHGLLVAALAPPLGRTLMLAKLDETVAYGGHFYELFTNCWPKGVIDPHGYQYLETFSLEGTTPVWTFACADAQVQKRVWMQPGANTTYVRYDLLRAKEPLTLTLKALVNYRDHHGATRCVGDWMRVEPVKNGLRVVACDDAVPFYLFSDSCKVYPKHVWNYDFYLTAEAYRGLETVEDHLQAGDFQVILKPGDSVTLVASTDATPNLDGASAYAERQAYEQSLVQRAALDAAEPESVRHLVLAADQFVVRRDGLQGAEGRSIIAGYPWFADWGRDTLIALPGLTLAAGRADAARDILRASAGWRDRGLLPNNFSEAGALPGYNTVDAALWYVEAVRATVAATQDRALLAELFPALEDILAWYQRGTDYQIHADPKDGLLYAGEPGVQLTWMDAKVDDWVVTPRTGKPVEVNALWYHALRCMADFAGQLGKPPAEIARYETAADLAQEGFARFWDAQAGYCYDVIDGPEGEDASLRPNQLLAVSLLHSPLNPEQQRAVVDVCARHLLTSHGLRSLAPDDPQFVGHYGGDQRERDGAYHQGTVWGWLMGPFVKAHLRVYRDPALARTFLSPLLQELKDHGVGSISEIFDGDPPFSPRGCIAQAWSVAELLDAWQAAATLASKS